MRYLNCTVIGVSLLTPGLTPAQPQPDYSGAWQQVNARCIPKPKNKHASYRLVIEQNAAALHLLIMTNKGQLNLDYELDGKELVYTGLDGDQFHTKVHRNGQSLVFDTVEYERGHKVVAKEVWMLLDSGHTLRRVKQEDEPDGQFYCHLHSRKAIRLWGAPDSALYRCIRLTQTRYFQSGARSLSTNRKNEPAVIVSAGMPEYVSMRHRKYGERHGRRRYPRVDTQIKRNMEIRVLEPAGRWRFLKGRRHSSRYESAPPAYREHPLSP
jgi:hypothetical protein